jgi:hypothetical protein
VAARRLPPHAPRALSAAVAPDSARRVIGPTHAGEGRCGASVPCGVAASRGGNACGWRHRRSGAVAGPESSFAAPWPAVPAWRSRDHRPWPQRRRRAARVIPSRAPLSERLYFAPLGRAGAAVKRVLKMACVPRVSLSSPRLAPGCASSLPSGSAN